MTRKITAATIVLLFAIGSGAQSGCKRSPSPPQSTFNEDTATHAELVQAARGRGAPNCSEDFRFRAANSSLGLAERQMAIGDFRRANIALRDGLQEIGNINLGVDVADDTSLAISAARESEWEGKLQDAAIARKGILADQVKFYIELHNLQHCPSPAESLEAPIPPLKPLKSLE